MTRSPPSPSATGPCTASSGAFTLTLGAGSGIATYPAGSHFGPRRLRDYELVWILEGQVGWHCADQQIDLGPGSILFLQPGMRDRFRWDPQRRSRHGFIHCQIDAAPADLGPIDSWPLQHSLTPDNPVLPLLDHCLLLLAQRPDGWAAQVCAGLGFVFRALCSGQCQGLQTNQPPYHPALTAMLDGIARHWAHGPTTAIELDTLCHWAGVSRVHLTRLCREAFARSPVAVVRSLRLHRVAELLASSHESIAQISERCGFANPFHCTRAFGESYGLSPSAYRKQMQAGEACPLVPLVQLQRLPE